MKKIRRQDIPIIIIIGLGIIFRIGQFLYNRSLTEGEAALALNIIHRSYPELLKPLDYVQAAPIGFLYIQRFFFNIFGNNDYSLRIFPLIAGISSIFLFYLLTRKLLSRNAKIFALFIFVVNNELIYFASEAKQYSSDVTICLLLVLFILNIVKNFHPSKLIFLGIIGAIALWFSHPSIFVFWAGIIILVIQAYKNKRINYLSFILAIIPYIISFGIDYYVNLRATGQNQELLAYWEKSFMPLPPQSLTDLKWFAYVFLRTFKNPLGFSIYELLFAVLSFLVGLVCLWKRNRYELAVLLLPVILALFASGLKKFPFEGRVILFIIPMMTLLVAYGLDYIMKAVSESSRLLGICLVSLPLLVPGVNAFHRLFVPRAPEELRPVLHYVRNHKKDGDIIYLYYASYNAFLYYSERYGFKIEECIVGTYSWDDWTKYYSELEKFKGKPRVWFLFSHVIKTYGVDEEKLFITYLNMLGKRIDEFRAPGATAYLYDLSD